MDGNLNLNNHDHVRLSLFCEISRELLLRGNRDHVKEMLVKDAARRISGMLSDFWAAQDEIRMPWQEKFARDFSKAVQDFKRGGNRAEGAKEGE